MTFVTVEMQQQVPYYLHLLVFSSKEFHKMAFFAPGLFQVLGRTYYLEENTRKNAQY